jgi:hypothetical protein
MEICFVVIIFFFCIIRNKPNAVISGSTGLFADDDEDEEKISLLSYFEKSK